jgi:hypothetical protein
MNTALRLPLAMPKRGDWDGFLTLTTDNLAKTVILPAILLGTFHLAPEVVYGRILAGLGLTLFIGQLGFVFIARRLAAREGRSDVTALPYGISTPAMFVFLFAILGPVYAARKDPLSGRVQRGRVPAVARGPDPRGVDRFFAYAGDVGLLDRDGAAGRARPARGAQPTRKRPSPAADVAGGRGVTQRGQADYADLRRSSERYLRG